MVRRTAWIPASAGMTADFDPSAPFSCRNPRVHPVIVRDPGAAGMGGRMSVTCFLTRRPAMAAAAAGATSHRYMRGGAFDMVGGDVIALAGGMSLCRMRQRVR